MVSRYSEHSFLWVHISKKSPSLRLMQHISLISQIWTLQLAYCLSYSLIFFLKKDGNHSLYSSTPPPSSTLAWISSTLYEPSAFLNRVESSTAGEKGVGR